MLAVDHNIVKEDKHKSAKEKLEKLVLGGLKSRWCNAEAEGHYSILVMALVSAKSSFGNVSGAHSDLMETLG